MYALYIIRGKNRIKKKILIISILSVFILGAISFASAINSNITTNVENKESPLYRLRTRLAIGEKISQIFENIKTSFLGERIFFIPFQWLKYNSGYTYSTSFLFCYTENYPYTCVKYCGP